MKRHEATARFRVGAVILAGLTGCVVSLASGISPATALEAYRRGSFRNSQTQYSELAKESPQDPRLRFNAGAAAYRQNDLTNAAAWFESVLGAPDLNLQQQAYYNLGNARFKLGEAVADPKGRKQYWNEALTNYVSAMKLDGADTNAAANYALVRRQLEELQQQLSSAQQQSSGDNSKDPKNEEKKDSSSESQQQGGKDSQGQQQSAKNDPNQPPPGSEKSEKQDTGGPREQQQARADEEPSPGKQEGQEEQKKSGSQPEDQEKKGAPAAAQPGAGKDQGAVSSGEAGEERPGEMSAAQAVQMLEGQKGDEKALLLRAYGNGKEAAERAARVRKPW